MNQTGKVKPERGRRLSHRLNSKKEELSTNVRKRDKIKEVKREEVYSEELQQKDSIVLRVAEETVSVEKEILIASSEYFKALFSGNFADSSAKELDLTEDVESIEDLIILLHFIRSGQVEITEHNLNLIIRVSCFFLVDSLTEKCAKFMSDTMSLANCLQYHFISCHYGLPKSIRRKFETLLETRFHDFIMYEDDVTELLSDNELKLLLISGIMKYCTKESLFNFLLKWMSKRPELTDKQFSLISDIIQYFEHCKTVQTVPFQCDKKKTIANINRMIVSNRKSCDPALLQKFRQLFTNFLRSKEHSLERVQQDTSESCIGVFTFSKRNCIRDSTVGKNDSNCPQQSSQVTSAGTNETCDLCVYRPDTKVWFHIASFGVDLYFSEVDERPYCPTVHLRQRYQTDIFCDIIATGEEVLFCDISNKFKLVRYSFRSRRWTHFNITDMVTCNVTHLQFECARNGTVYLITRSKIPGSSQTVFRGYTCNLDSLEAHEIFSTVCADIRQRSILFNTSHVWSQMTVKLSSASNELLILCTDGDGENLVILVELGPHLNGGKVESHTLLHTISRDATNCVELLFVDVDILETDDRFLVVSSENEFLTIKFQYKFHTKVLNVVEDGAKHQLNLRCDGLSEKRTRSHFRNSYWVMEREYGLGSHNGKITFNNFGKPNFEFHTPPPFVDTIAVYATEIRKSLFWDLEPIRNFLEPARK